MRNDFFRKFGFPSDGNNKDFCARGDSANAKCKAWWGGISGSSRNWPVTNESEQAKSGGARDTPRAFATSAREAGTQGRAVDHEPIAAR